MQLSNWRNTLSAEIFIFVKQICTGYSCTNCKYVQCTYQNWSLAIGLAVGLGVFVLICIIIGIYFCLQRRKRAKSTTVVTTYEMAPQGGYPAQNPTYGEELSLGLNCCRSGHITNLTPFSPLFPPLYQAPPLVTTPLHPRLGTLRPDTPLPDTPLPLPDTPLPLLGIRLVELCVIIMSLQFDTL